MAQKTPKNPYKNPNPQGKGLVPVLQHWRETRPANVASKSPEQLLVDWFSSTLVLSAQFQFRPTAGVTYFLYARDGALRLSLVSPQEWGASAPLGACIGACELREDMTWSIAPDPGLATSAELQELLQSLVEDFSRSLASTATLDAQLPGYRRSLPYYQRLLATGLGSSLRGSAGRALLDRPGRTLIGPSRGLAKRLLGD